MLRTTLGTSLFVCTSAAAFGQTATPPPVFEVASVRVSAIGKAGGEGSRRENVQFSPDSLNMRNIRLTGAIAWAYHVFDYQVSGPEWMDVERYDISAKGSGAVSEDQLRAMLQPLLAERLKVAVHHQTKEMAGYALSVAKGGPKFQESQGEGELKMEPDQRRMVVTVQRAPVSQLVEMLTRLFRAPVVDMTELKGKYDITISLSKYLADIQPSPGGAPPDPLTIITRGLQEELGLKLEARKMAIDLVVVDHADKTPVEN